MESFKKIKKISDFQTRVKFRVLHLAPKWTPPPDGWLMLTVDAATFKDPSRIGIRGVIHDYLEDFKMTFCKKMQS